MDEAIDRANSPTSAGSSSWRGPRPGRGGRDQRPRTGHQGLRGRPPHPLRGALPCARFPFLLEDVRGHLTYRRPFVAEDRRGKVFAFDVTGRADGAPLHLRGRGAGPRGPGCSTWTGTDVPLGAGPDRGDPRVRDHPGRPREGVAVAPSPRDGGRDGGRADRGGPPPAPAPATLKGASFSLDAEGCPEPLTIVDVRGTIAAEGERVELRDLAAASPTEGRSGSRASWTAGSTARWDLSVSTDLLRLTPTLRAALERAAGGAPLLPPEAGIDPGSRLALDLRLRREPGPAAEVRTDVRARHVDGAIRLPGGLALALRGDEVTVRGDEIVLLNVEAEAPGIAGAGARRGPPAGGSPLGAVPGHAPGPRAHARGAGPPARGGSARRSRTCSPAAASRARGSWWTWTPPAASGWRGSSRILVARGSAPDAGPRGGLEVRPAPPLAPGAGRRPHALRPGGLPRVLARRRRADRGPRRGGAGGVPAPGGRSGGTGRGPDRPRPDCST